MVYYADDVNRDEKLQYFIIVIHSFVFIAKHIRIAGCFKKLQIGCVIEGDKVKHFSSFYYFLFIYVLQLEADFLEEKIYEFDEYVRLVDIILFNKI